MSRPLFASLILLVLAAWPGAPTFASDCPANKPHLCIGTEDVCVRNETECTAANICPGSRPFLCSDGRTCVSYVGGCSKGPRCGWKGHVKVVGANKNMKLVEQKKQFDSCCKAGLQTCTVVWTQKCPSSKPFRCADSGVCTADVQTCNYKVQCGSRTGTYSVTIARDAPKVSVQETARVVDSCCQSRTQTCR